MSEQTLQQRTRATLETSQGELVYYRLPRLEEEGLVHLQGDPLPLLVLGAERVPEFSLERVLR